MKIPIASVPGWKTVERADDETHDYQSMISPIPMSRDSPGEPTQNQAVFRQAAQTLRVDVHRAASPSRRITVAAAAKAGGPSRDRARIRRLDEELRLLRHGGEEGAGPSRSQPSGPLEARRQGRRAIHAGARDDDAHEVAGGG
jgi:hypothetical protein